MNRRSGVPVSARGLVAQRTGLRSSRRRPDFPPLFFREEWRQIDRPPNAPADFVPEGGVTPSAVTNPNLELRLYDPNAKSIPRI